MQTIAIETQSEPKPKNALLRNVGATILARLGYMASRVAIPPFVMAHMTLQEYGVWTSAFVLVAYLGVSTMGISNVYIRYIAKYEAEGDHRSANELLSTGLFVTVPMCAVLFGLLTWFWPVLASAVHLPVQLAGDAKEAIYLVVLIFLSSISLCAYTDALTGVQRIDVVQKIWVAGYVIETILIFALVGAGRGVRGMAEAFFARTILSIALSIFYAPRIIPWLRISPRLVGMKSLKDLLSFGSVVQIQCLLDVVLASIERVLALIFSGFEIAGLLEISKKMPTSISAIPLAFAAAFVPAASNLEACSKDNAAAAVRELYLSGARHMNLVTAYFCGFLTLLAKPILDVWLGRSLPGSEVLFPLFAVAMQFHLSTGPGTSISKGIGRPFEEFHYCVPNILLLGITVPLAHLYFGSYAAVSIGCAVASATILSAVYFLWRSDRQMRIPHLEYLKKVFLPGLIPYALALPIAAVIGSHGLQNVHRSIGAVILMAAGCVYTLVYAVVAYRWLLDEEQKERISLFINKAVASWRVMLLTKSEVRST